MDWKIASLIALGAWSLYGIFGSKAGEIHGEKVSMVFETVAFIILTTVVISSAVNDFHRITPKSFFYASLMGILSASGFYFVLYAMRLSPQNWAVIILISGMYPAMAAVIGYFSGTQLALHQWAGVVLATFGLVLVNWPK